MKKILFSFIISLALAASLTLGLTTTAWADGNIDTTTEIGEPAEPIELAITNNTAMFKAVTASAVENTDGSATLTVALQGSGYKNLYKGTYEQAKANGDATENWIPGNLNDAGKYEFVIHIAASEMETDVPVVAISQHFYDKYLNGQNPIERAFYPRQLNLSLEAAALVTGDYHSVEEISVTNNISMFGPAATATLDCVSGPNSNNYKADLVLPMTNESWEAAFAGTPAEAAEAADIIEFNTEDRSFTIPVKWIGEIGHPETEVNLADGEPFDMSFRYADNWYGCVITLDEEAGTLLIDPHDWTNNPNFVLPADVGTIEANAFDGLTEMIAMDARNCKKIGAEAFKGCTELVQIRLDKDCDIDENAFSGCGIIDVFAPEGGKTQTFCNSHDGFVFVKTD